MPQKGKLAWFCGLLGFVALVVGNGRAESALTGWGSYWDGEAYKPMELLDDIGGVVDLAVGWGHRVALLPDGSLRTWGANFSGQTSVPSEIGPVTDVAAGDNHTLALLEDGSVRAWGANDLGQCSVPVGLSDVVAVAAGDAHSLALTRRGKVVAWGWNERGQTDVPADLRGVVALAAGSHHSLALRGDGVVVVWGGVRDRKGHTYLPGRWKDVVAIAAGETHSLALRESGEVVAWGENHFGQIEVPGEARENVVAIAAAGYGSVALRGDGRVVAWGDGYAGSHFLVELEGGPVHRLALGKEQGLAVVGGRSPTVRPLLPGRVVGVGQEVRLHAEVGGERPLAYQWQRNGVDLPGATAASLHLSEIDRSDAGEYRVVVSNEWGRIVSTAMQVEVGGRDPLQLVVWGTIRSDWPGIPKELNDPVAIAAGWDHALALQRDGVVRAWGLNVQATAVPDHLHRVVEIAAGPGHSMVLQADGIVKVWGLSKADTLPPTVPHDLRKVVAIDCDEHFLALREDATVVAWGANEWGQANVPNGLGDVVAISAGFADSLALRRDGTVVGWGATPVPEGLVDIVAISAGVFGGMALRSDGTLVSWGEEVEAPPVGLDDIVAVRALRSRSLVLRADGSYVQWRSPEAPVDLDRFREEAEGGIEIDREVVLRPEGGIGGVEGIVLDPVIRTEPIGVFYAIDGSAHFSMALMGEPAPVAKVPRRVDLDVSEDGEAMQLTIPQTQLGRVYCVEYLDSNAGDEIWRLLVLKVGNGNMVEALDPELRNSAGRLYRISVW